MHDEVALDLVLKIAKATEAQVGQGAVDPAQKAILAEMVENQGRLGRKNRKGFYDYPEQGQKKLWPGLRDLQETRLDPDAVDFQELKQRLLVTQALEAARTFGEGVVTDPREADVGSILGFGFAPFTGGTLSYIDFMGAAAFVEDTARRVARMGAQWMAAGFVHGVLNTDNINITGESFDYGPWRFLPRNDPNFTAAYFDHSGLYSFGRQPEALFWNLSRLADCLLGLVPKERLEAGLKTFGPALQDAFAEALQWNCAPCPTSTMAGDSNAEDSTSHRETPSSGSDSEGELFGRN